ncbi:MAG: hypothetical protein A2091_03270 [Desulfuromonadales bacterium GWD2_61_12]|nr:MAG: hypothetical protein A2005_09425 [Desulfuromonadales bacterium GWC2_61_20]OGR36139.1 MAG: hypothetical protein A2091_03270 [Desulfuromonadales bacterium GWD2_61_12]HAD05315.1 arylesterase [Desulfuromonas sp.]HBT83415.1 arylesterase [Desulfuromonas sp.]
MNIRLLLFLFLLLPLVACDRGPRLTPLAADAVILAFGDSLTYGTGAGTGEAYPAVLQNLLDRIVINAGMPGELSATGLARLPALLDEHRPALVILCHGGNDLLQQRDPEELAANLRAMVGLARAAGADVVLVGVPQPGLLLQTAPLYAGIAKELHLPFADDIIADTLQRPSRKSDYVHPNGKGYAEIAAALVELIHQAEKK